MREGEAAPGRVAADGNKEERAQGTAAGTTTTRWSVCQRIYGGAVFGRERRRRVPGVSECSTSKEERARLEEPEPTPEWD
jgi:hypothetical protein